MSIYFLPFARKCLILQAKFLIMIDKIRIENYKSIVDLTLELGRFNVIIGTNGCGKSNILEAITMGALGVSDNADIGRLAKHGIRVTDSNLMVNAFEDTDDNMSEFIQLQVSGDNKPYDTGIALEYEEKWNKWVDIKPKEYSIIKQHYIKEHGETTNEEVPYNEYHRLRKELIEKPTFLRFLTYSPNESVMREMVRSIDVYPLGVHGEGLFQYLKLTKTRNIYPLSMKGSEC